MKLERYSKMLKNANKKLEHIKTLKNVQENNLEDNYMVGLYNGMELAVSILEDRKPKYKSCINKTEVIETKETKQSKGRTVFSGERRISKKNE